METPPKCRYRCLLIYCAVVSPFTYTVTHVTLRNGHLYGDTRPTDNTQTRSLVGEEVAEGAIGAIRAAFRELVMELSPRLGVVFCVLQLLLLTTCSDVNRPSPAADNRPSSATDNRPSSATDNRPSSATDNRPTVRRRPPPVVRRRPTASRLPPTTVSPPVRDLLVRDCSDLPSDSASGEYQILEDLSSPTSVYCDTTDGEGWTVFQRRGEFPPQRDFLRNWEEYKWGFGLLEEEFWWGLEYLWRLTSQPDRVYELRVRPLGLESATADPVRHLPELHYRFRGRLLPAQLHTLRGKCRRQS